MRRQSAIIPQSKDNAQSWLNTTELLKGNEL